MKKDKVYNLNTFNFYRRQVKHPDLDRAFNKLIEEEEEKRKEKGIVKLKEKILFNSDNKTVNKGKKFNSDNYNNNSISMDNNSKNININLIFRKNSIERIMRIRDLFLEFSADKNGNFDENEIYLMFNMNKIPIKRKEVKDLFGFNNNKKYINFFEFIQTTINKSFSNKFKKLIMEKIRYRKNKTDICPNDFDDMLSHLCEFRKLSPQLKDKTREEHNLYIPKIEENHSQSFNNSNGNLIRDSCKGKSRKRKSIINQILQDLSKKEININNMDFNNEKVIKEIREKPNLLKKEKEFKNFMEISNKKFIRFNDFIESANIKDRILKRKEKISKSLKILDNINSNKYLCYYPTENTFKNLKNDKNISLSFKKIKSKLPPIKYNISEKILSDENRNIKRNVCFNDRYKNFNKCNFIKLLKKKGFDSKNKLKNIKEKLKEKEYASILANLSLSNTDLPAIESISDIKYTNYNNIKRYTENTFVTTSLHSNLNKLQNQL